MGNSRDRSYGITGSGSTAKTLDRYLELQEPGNTDLETRIYSRQDDGASEMEVDIVDDRSQKRMLVGRKKSDTGMKVQVTRDITVTVSDGR